MSVSNAIIIFVLSLLGTKLSLIALIKYKILDNPNDRSNHKIPVPRGGGIAMIAVSLLFLFHYKIDIFVIIAAFLLAIISFIDDMKGVSVKWRLFAQIIGVSLVLCLLPTNLFPEYMPIWVEKIFIALGWLWFINLTNFMYGIDGITAMQTISMCLGISLLVDYNPNFPSEIAVYARVIEIATIGFLWFNRSPAKVFAGDVGSITLGFLIGYLLIRLADSGGIIPALILPAYYLCDATSTLIKRLLRGDKVWQAHSEHAYQQAVRNGMSHNMVVTRIAGLNLLLMMLAMIAGENIFVNITALICAYAVTTIFIIKLRKPVVKK